MSSARCRRFEGRVTMVTGGASGIGEATALRLAEEGAVVVVADLDRDKGEALAAANERIEYVTCDVTAADSVRETIAGIVHRHGRLDAAHANAGIESPPLLLADTSDEWFDRAVDVNTKGVFLVCKYAVLHMLERGGGGAICCTSSIHEVASYPKIGVYAISKAAVGAIVRAIASDYGRDGIRANAILPGATLTPMVQREIDDAPDPEAQRKLIGALQAMKRFAQPAEIAAAAAFLMSDDSSFMTGASVAVDGGALAGLPGPDVLDPDRGGKVG